MNLFDHFLFDYLWNKFYYFVYNLLIDSNWDFFDYLLYDFVGNFLLYFFGHIFVMDHWNLFLNNNLFNHDDLHRYFPDHLLLLNNDLLNFNINRYFSYDLLFDNSWNLFDDLFLYQNRHLLDYLFLHFFYYLFYYFCWDFFNYFFDYLFLHLPNHFFFDLFNDLDVDRYLFSYYLLNRYFNKFNTNSVILCLWKQRCLLFLLQLYWYL